MNRDEIIGKKIYHKENKIGEVVELKRDPFGGHSEIIIIETSKNDYKAMPLEYVETVANRLELQKDRTPVDRFPSLSSADIEEERDKYRNALKEHYGEPQQWNREKDGIKEGEDEAYMGSSQITNQAPEDNETLKDKMDYDKIKRGRE